MKKQIVFFGGIGSPSEFGGELSKNKEIISRLKELGYDVTTIDSFRCRQNKVKLLKVVFRFMMCILFYPKATFLFSTSFGNIYPLIKMLNYYPIKLHIVYWVIGGIFADKVAKGIYQSKYLKNISFFLVEGLRMKDSLQKSGFINTLYVPNFKTIGKLPIIQKVEDGRIHFLFISRIMPDKGCRYILQCVSALNKKGLKDKYVIDFYGNIDSSYKHEFLMEINKYDNINYLGSLQLQEESNYIILAKYHYMLFPTYWLGEGFPGVIIDAYKAGVPIIGSDWNFNSEFIKDGITGIIIPTHDVDKLLLTMENVITNKYNNQKMSLNCQEKALEYDTSNVITIDLTRKIFVNN